MKIVPIFREYGGHLEFWAKLKAGHDTPYYLLILKGRFPEIGIHIEQEQSRNEIESFFGKHG